MIANDLRSVMASMRAYSDGKPVPAKTMQLFVERLEEIAERVDRFERMPVPAAFRLTDQSEDERLVFIRAHERMKPRLARSDNGGDAA
ncbi:MAG: hypothetical protein Q7V31_03585 [Parvibaculum sp.]|uniref:hypothetical protein n=1 Tax=Parvibaculum sp. TaxID=2024848 RepID=UPI002715CBA8|nr:hypothetical protein [Parvibaculum sp.]MDO8837984.1 hypothetical protein [Parvibaculum sp.]